MKLQRLRVEQVRQFRAPFVLNDLNPGLNLIHGPNESGKSTLVRAIRAAFFERYRSKSVQDLCPWGDSSAAPTVELEFEHQGTQWRLIKSFLKRTRCDLTIGGDSFSEDEAEERVAELLGYEYSKKGGSKAAHWGIPGLLWVEQGTGQDIEQAVEHAGDHLQSALNTLVGEVASSGGDAVIDKVTAERGALLTRTGQPTGEYRQLGEAREGYQEAVNDLESRVAQYQQQVDRLQAVTKEFQKHQQERPWDKAQTSLEEAQARLAGIQQLEQQQQRELETLGHLEQQHELTAQNLAQMKRAGEQLAERREALEMAEQRLRATESQSNTVTGELAAATEAYNAAARQLTAARAQDQRARLVREKEQAAQRKQTLSEQLEKARTYQVQLNEALKQSQENRIDVEAVAELKRSDRALREARIRSEAIASRLSWALEPGVLASLDDHPITGDGAEQLLDRARLRIAGVGTFDITPGGDQLADTRRTLAEREQSVQAQLDKLSVPSPEDAEERKARFEAAEQRRMHAEDLLRSVAPSGIEVLGVAQAEAASELEALEKRLGTAPEVVKANVPALAEAEVEFSRAESRLKAAERAEREYQTLLLTRRQARDNAHSEWYRLDREFQSNEHQKKLAGLEERFGALSAEKREKAGRVERRKEQIRQARPDILRQDIERFEKTIQHLHDIQAAREREMREIKVRLEAWGAEGLEEQLSEARVGLEQCNRRYQELSRRARALDLLLSLLVDQRQALTRRLQAPLQKHLDHYVSLLFPEARLEVDEQLQPGRFSRGRELGHVGELSFGAREQMGLISRLAYADLLLEADRPTLIMLDDTLVHSDQSRLDAMKRILFDAARRHQILLFTCHPEKWQDLGVAPVDLEHLKKSPPTPA
ncbi:AAA family ATPase [Marinobacter daepoensis]|uniref:AAA family ATPase n=1 Tax=Marinobacter daepoensis TaxID=262077 RepID=UPI001C98B3C7|nr:AAA family ATPase [Marinobacter daepoensis]MBY6032247.1 AAA family ATPase [Marinobacter daepoensis]